MLKQQNTFYLKKVSIGGMFAPSTILGDFGESLLTTKVIYRDLCFHRAGPGWTGLLLWVLFEDEHNTVMGEK